MWISACWWPSIKWGQCPYLSSLYGLCQITKPLLQLRLRDWVVQSSLSVTQLRLWSTRFTFTCSEITKQRELVNLAYSTISEIIFYISSICCAFLIQNNQWLLTAVLLSCPCSLLISSSSWDLSRASFRAFSDLSRSVWTWRSYCCLSFCQMKITEM